MDDLISRQAAIDAINKAFERVFAWDGTSPLGDKVLENVPSAQPEIIRCEDCMHNGSFDTDCPIVWNGKEYCSFAERIEDG